MTNKVESKQRLQIGSGLEEILREADEFLERERQIRHNGKRAYQGENIWLASTAIVNFAVGCFMDLNNPSLPTLGELCLFVASIGGPILLGHSYYKHTAFQKPDEPSRDEGGEEMCNISTRVIMDLDLPVVQKLKLAYNLLTQPDIYFSNSVKDFVDNAPHSYGSFFERPFYRIMRPILSSTFRYYILKLFNVGITELDEHGREYQNVLWVHDGTGSAIMYYGKPPLFDLKHNYPQDRREKKDQMVHLTIVYEGLWNVGYVVEIEPSKGNFPKHLFQEMSTNELEKLLPGLAHS